MATPYYVPYKGQTVTRVEAKATGLSRFFTGKLCKHGHLSQRTTANGGCIACNDTTNYRNYHSDDPEKRATRADRHAQTMAWKAAHREKVREWGREYSKANREQGNAWKAANRDKINAAEREARQLNPDRFRESAVRYLRSPKGKAVQAVKSHKRRSRMANVEGWHTPADLLEMFEQQSGRCVYCEIELGTKYHVDHIRPISRGGSNWISNIQLLCARCNRSKWALDHDEYLRRLSNQET